MERSGRLLDVSQNLPGSESHRPSSASSTSDTSSSGSTVSDSSSVDSFETPTSLWAKLTAAAAVELDFSDVLAAANYYRIPSESSDAIGVGNYLLRDVISVGTGLTARVIQHDTGVAAPKGVPKNTIVALKVFSNVDRGPQARQDVYRSILREMDAFCDPRLRRHPNIVQLLFVSWHPSEQYPMLAMELGAYGSLEHILCSPDAVQPSQIQKRHMTMDMALGLQAIHGAEMVHGDIKPANMIVFEHSCPDRGLIVKLTDFGGSGMVFGAQPAHFTPLWCAPEVLNRDANVDWEKADVYSLGLVMASLWDRQIGQDPFLLPEGTSNSSILHNCLPKPTESFEDELEIMTRLKHISATEDGSVGGLLMRRLELLRDELGDNFELLVETLLLATHICSQARPDVDELVVLLAPLITSLERNTGQQEVTGVLSHLAHDGEIEKYRPSPWPKLSMEDIYTKSNNFKATMYQQTAQQVKDIEASGQSDLCLGEVPSEIPDDMLEAPSTHAFLDMLLDAVEFDSLTSEGARKLLLFLRKGAYHHYLGYCQTEGNGDMRDTVHGLEHLATAGIHGSAIGILYSLFVLDDKGHTSGGVGTNREFSTRLYLILSALAGSRLALERLSTEWPQHFAMVRRAMRERPEAYRKAREQEVSLLSAQVIVEAYCYDENPLAAVNFTLQDALEIGAINEVQQLLCGESGKTPEAANLHEGLLHGLKGLTDSEASSLLHVACEAGARLDSISGLRDPFWAQMLEGIIDYVTPLAAAIVYGQIELATGILSLHIERDEPIRLFPATLFLAYSFLQHELGDMLLQILKENPGLCGDLDSLPVSGLGASNSWRRPTAEWDFDRVMTMALVSVSTAQMHVRSKLQLGLSWQEAYEATLQSLVSEGANPVGGGECCTPLGSALMADDVAALRLFTHAILANTGHEGLRESLENPCAINGINDPELFLGGHSWGHAFSALSLCLRHDSLRCFEFILEHCSLAPATQNSDFLGLSLMHRASGREQSMLPDFYESGMPSFLTLVSRAGPRLPDIRFLKLLLKHRPEPLAVDERGISVVAWALGHGNIAAANLILLACSEEQRIELLGRNPNTGTSVFWQLLCADSSRAWPGGQRQQALVASLQWLNQHQALHLYGEFASRGNSTDLAWFVLLKGGPRLSRVDQLLDAAIVDYLLDNAAFADIINAHNHEGLTMLHRAVMQTNVEVVRVLLSRGAQVNSPLGLPTQRDWLPKPGTLSSAVFAMLSTPLDLSCMHMSGAALTDEMETWSSSDISRWRADVVEITRLLVSHGGNGLFFSRTQRYARLVSSSSAEQSFEPRFKPNFCAWPQQLPLNQDSGVSPHIPQRAYTTSPFYGNLLSAAPDLNAGNTQGSVVDIKGKGPAKNHTCQSLPVCNQSLLDNDGHGNTQLHTAAQGGSIAILRAVLEKAKPNIAVEINRENHDGLSPLDLVLAPYRSTTPPHISTSESSLILRSDTIEDLATRTRLLLTAGADPNRSSTGFSPPPLHECLRSHGDCVLLVEILLEAGADVNLGDIQQRTPLMFAATNGYLESMVLLLTAGADRCAISYQGLTAADYAFENKHFEAVEILHDWQ